MELEDKLPRQAKEHKPSYLLIGNEGFKQSLFKYGGLSLLIILVLTILNYNNLINLPKKTTGGYSSKTSTIQSSPVFSAQNATIEGQITKLEGNKIFVKAKNNEFDNFQAGEKVMIYKYSQNNTKPQTSSELKDLDLNKDAVIFLAVKDSKYQIVSVSYLP